MGDKERKGEKDKNRGQDRVRPSPGGIMIGRGEGEREGRKK